MRRFERRPKRPCRVHNQPQHGRIANSSPHAASEPLLNGKRFFKLLPVPELRNLVYEAFFESFIKEIATGKCTCRRVSLCPALAMMPCLNLLEVSRQMRAETRGMFFELYFTRQTYTLHSLPGVQSFLRLPSPWISQQHEIVLISKDINIAVHHTMVLRHAFTSAGAFRRLGRGDAWLFTQRHSKASYRSRYDVDGADWIGFRKRIQAAYPDIFTGDPDFQQLANHEHGHYNQSRPDGSFATQDDPKWRGYEAELMDECTRGLVPPGLEQMGGVEVWRRLESGCQKVTTEFKLTVRGGSEFSIGPLDFSLLDWSRIPQDHRLLFDRLEITERRVDDVTFAPLVGSWRFDDIPVYSVPTPPRE